MVVKEKTKTVRFIEYDGMKFYEDGKGYWLGSQIGEDGLPHRVRLHIYVWEKFNGPVPEGYDVHHIDHDKANNEIENLIAIPKEEHLKLHAAEMDKDKARMNLLKYAQPEANKWHKSEAGREWHKQHYAQTIGKEWDEMVTKSCEYCGKSYEVPKPKASTSRFCSNNCRTRFRYHAGLDNVERVCVVCGKTFVTNKYSHVKTCSPECSAKSCSKTKIAKRHRKQ